ncbi:hypothetical protein [Nocardia terpenica]|uniref:Uncharacterized protein n=1 Tax=Nocardia terpenica TaxID=455432 RepID=A0A164JW79_9NOCA|nr:hypothetical protein [Nocardia terpenica]KZM70782.1 hypothetical protein AWN90_40205 [Nocardia terpenica]NQE89953.1 hypothetical protein [Nocardia terpenica]
MTPSSLQRHGDRLALAADTISTDVVLVSSATARRWLASHRRNRPLSKQSVARYQSDMAAGLWTFAADPIRFDVEGHLIDGRHRLVALAGCAPPLSLPFLVVRGLPTEAQLVMDQGRKRNAGQQLSMLGVKNATTIAAGVRILLLWDSGLLFRDNKLATRITVPIIQQWVSGNPGPVEFVNDRLSLIVSTDAAPSVATAFALKTGAAAADITELFFRELHDLTGLAEGSPILALDRRFRRLRRESITMPIRDQLALFIQAWNAWLANKTVAKFQRPRGGTWTAESFPRPDITGSAGWQ